ncbi:MAG: exosome complex RNA-binding protein Csl4 [Euryarchaeota archaeon]|nr:exosome complex RNA-binding protein Csl4 [Euryarchaeota archaeon]
MPGDEIAAAEEYVCGPGTYELEGKIFASVAGRLRLDLREKVAEVKPFNPPAQLKSGDIVIGTVSAIRSSMAEVEISEIEGTERGITGDVDASLHVSKMSSRYVEDVRDVYRLGDYVRARVVQVSPSVQIVTDADDFGVIKALCSQCRSAMVLKGRDVYCENCERAERRKIARGYSTVE